VSYLFIAHDLAAVKYVSTRIGVMYLGKLVETASSEELYAHPLHPYTQILLSTPCRRTRTTRARRSSCGARCPVPSIPRAAAISSPLSPRDAQCAEVERPCARRLPGTGSPVTCTAMRAATTQP